VGRAVAQRPRRACCVPARVTHAAAAGKFCPPCFVATRSIGQVAMMSAAAASPALLSARMAESRPPVFVLPETKAQVLSVCRQPCRQPAAFSMRRHAAYIATMRRRPRRSRRHCPRWNHARRRRAVGRVAPVPRVSARAEPYIVGAFVDYAVCHGIEQTGRHLQTTSRRHVEERTMRIHRFARISRIRRKAVLPAERGIRSQQPVATCRVRRRRPPQRAFAPQAVPAQAFHYTRLTLRASAAAALSAPRCCCLWSLATEIDITFCSSSASRHATVHRLYVHDVGGERRKH